MSKKWWLRVVLISVLVFVITNLQYLPGPVGLFGVVTGLRIAMGWVLLLGIVVSIPVALTFIIVEWLKKNRNNSHKMRWTGAILSGIVFPVVAYASVYAGEEKFAGMSEEIAIRNAQPLIAAVEQFKQTKGYYPHEFDTKNYPTGVMGISEYQYHLVGKGYSISFRQYEALAITYRYAIYQTHELPQQGIKGAWPTAYRYWYTYQLYQ